MISNFLLNSELSSLSIVRRLYDDREHLRFTLRIRFSLLQMDGKSLFSSSSARSFDLQSASFTAAQLLDSSLHEFHVFMIKPQWQ